MNDGRKRRVHVTIGGPVPGAAATVEELVAAGFEIEERLDAIGVITGWADDDAIERLRSIDGVTVERERDVQLPPPDAPVQ
jgi:hypothetical protein